MNLASVLPFCLLLLEVVSESQASRDHSTAQYHRDYKHSHYDVMYQDSRKRSSYRKTRMEPKKTRVVFKARMMAPGVLTEDQLRVVKAELIASVDRLLRNATGTQRVRYDLAAQIKDRPLRKRHFKKKNIHHKSNHGPQNRNQSPTSSHKTPSHSGRNHHGMTSFATVKPSTTTTTSPLLPTTRKMKTTTTTTTSTQAPATRKHRKHKTKHPDVNATIEVEIPPGAVSTEVVYVEGVTNNPGFVPLVTQLFKECLRPTGVPGEFVVPMDNYILAYQHLCKMFDMFGTIFAFAGRDIQGKLTILQDLKKEDNKKGGTNYDTMENMFAYEFSKDAYSRPGVTANRMIAVALRYNAALIEALQNPANDNQTTSELGTKLYNEILAPEHPWYVRGVVYVALMSFPSRETLAANFNMEINEKSRRTMLAMAAEVNALYYHLYELYVKYQQKG